MGLKLLYDDAMTGRLAGVISLIEQGVPVNGYATVELTDLDIIPDNFDQYPVATPLYYATQRGHSHVVKYLLEQAADPNIPGDVAQTTPLLMSINQEVIHLLLAHGADPNKRNKYGQNSLHLHVRLKDPALIKTLLDHGANRTIISNYGRVVDTVIVWKKYPQSSNDDTILLDQIIDVLQNYWPDWTPQLHFRVTTDMHRKQIETVMKIRQHVDTPLSAMSPELMFQIFPYLTQRE